MCSSACELPSWLRTHGLGDKDCRGLSSCIESIGKFRFFLLFSRKLDRVAPNKLTELGCINYPVCLNYKNGFYTVK